MREWWCAQWRDTLVVVVVQRVKGIGVVDHHIEENLSVGRLGDILVLQGAPHHLHQLAQLAQLVATQAVVHGIAFGEVLLEDAVGPLAELDAALALYPIAYGDDDIKVVDCRWLILGKSIMQNLHITILL